MSSPHLYYSARVVAQDVSHRFDTLKDFQTWFNTITGGQDPSTNYSTIESWLKDANIGDLLYVDDLLEMTDNESAEIEIERMQ